MKRKEQTVRQQLREWYYDTPRKRGPKRQALHVETCFAPLLGWVVSWWQGTQLALAIDATTLGERFVVLAVSVVYRGCAIPVAWASLLPATRCPARCWPAGRRATKTPGASSRSWGRRPLRPVGMSSRRGLTRVLKPRRGRGGAALRRLSGARTAQAAPGWRGRRRCRGGPG